MTLQTIRFTLVQWAKGYVDLLKFVLVEKGYPERVAIRAQPKDMLLQLSGLVLAELRTN